MKTLVVAPQPFFTPRGTPFSVYYRTLIAAELGCPIDLLTYGEGQDIQIPGVRLIRIPHFPFLGNIKIGPSLLKLFLDIFIAIWTIGLLIRHKYTIVHAHEEAIFLCALLKPIFKYKLIYDMHSSLPEQLTNFQFTTFKPLIQTFKNWEDRCLNQADATITICPSLYNYACQIVSDTRKIFLIENSLFDDVQITPPNTPSPT
jgi:Glycosyltransferase Family 4